MIKLNKKAFTIVELVIVIAVIAILAAVLIPTFSNIIEKANESSALNEAKNALSSYIIMNNGEAKESTVIVVKRQSNYYYFGYIKNQLTRISKSDAAEVVENPEMLILCTEFDTTGFDNIESIIKDASGSSTVIYEDNKIKYDASSTNVSVEPKICGNFRTTTIMFLPILIQKQENAYLTFTATEANSSVTAKFNGGTFKYSFDNGINWEMGNINGTLINLTNIGDSVMLKGLNCTTDLNHHFEMSGKIEASGSVTSLTDDKGINENVILSEYCYQCMFYGCFSLTTAPELPAINLASGCYQKMFYFCISLYETPELPSKKLAPDCYCHMFDYCYMLTKATNLPATTLENYCYFRMFSNCKALTESPELPATILADGCYELMFLNCSSLTKIGQIAPATKYAYGCYERMFGGCTALTDLPSFIYNIDYTDVSLVTLGVYRGLFYNLKITDEILNNILPKNFQNKYYLPATDLCDECYYAMFKGCTELKTAPELPAITLADKCYSYMFNNCTSLKKAPVLYANVLASECYSYMFKGCSNLNISEGIPEKASSFGIIFTCPEYVGNDDVINMFLETNGTFAKNENYLGTPSSNLTYFWYIE